ncbi:MAG: hypothetical protein RI101_14635 [Nitrospira sp.]|jgi:hypothetical protein|nr:hypothetical protein [Nitrospira sp.]
MSEKEPQKDHQTPGYNFDPNLSPHLPCPFKKPEPRPFEFRKFKDRLYELFTRRAEEWGPRGSDVVASARQLAGAFLHDAIKDFSHMANDDCIKTLPHYLAVLGQKTHDQQTVTELFYLFDTLADYYQELHTKNKNPIAAQQPAFARYLSKFHMTNPEALDNGYVLAKHFHEMHEQGNL